MSDIRNDDQGSLREGLEKGANSVQDALGSVKAVARDAADSAGDTATSLASQAKEQAAATLSLRKDGIADRIDELADTVHHSGAQFEGKQDWIASAIDRGAAELGSLAKALRDNDLASLFKQVQTIARQQPALFIGASLAAGFAAARLGKLIAADISHDELPTLRGGNHARA
jgi:hypothetical protein